MIDFSKIKYYEKSAPTEAISPASRTDLCIYGASSAGLAAAVQATRMGLKVVVAEFGQRAGGLSSGGLGATDIGNKAAIGGISREFYQAIGQHYGITEGDKTQWTFEPHIAEAVYLDWIQHFGIEVHFGQQLASVQKENGKIVRIVMEKGESYEADMFIDATYEGDLLAAAGVSYHVGREANSVYRETLNGIQFGSPNHRFNADVSPYVIPGKPDSGLIYGVSDAAPGVQGQGDRSVQAYNFRICLTDVPDNRIPFPAPPNYDPDKFTLLARYIQAGVWDALRLHKHMPNGKTDLNNYGGVSTDHIGMNFDWPEGSYTRREELFQDHLHYNLGMLYFLSNDERVPQSIREEVRKWGLPADEYGTSGHWTPQLYIREARRMVSDYIMTENECRGYRTISDPVGLAAYQMDSHNSRRIVLEGQCVNEGNVEIAPTLPYPISYRSIVPKEEECINLLVPVCLSSSHIAYGSIRMEPVFMILGQSAATAAALALEAGVAVQNIDYNALRKRLLEDNQVLEWTIA
ncbi:FAD-dependent oxidoreductase [Paenibacillus nasutitermitis]|uniref:Xanthan lyase n=1 Tax=Paenibacillus nasutitermitis TaxID=1652958 RepID=A0A916Z8N8_9BACL|nr:FAD-dependent oxidoreductase [Paenibacillus nasutitermitis]GGD80199.1 xanthan lyase [Paenibacillus nasutitermitis]